MRGNRRRLLGLAALACAALWGLVVHPYLVIVAGYGATVGALCVHGSGDAPERVVEQRFPARVRFLRLDVDEATRSVEATALYVTRRAVYRPGLGATRDAGLRVDLPPGLPEPAPAPDLPWPDGDAPVVARPAPDVDAARLAAALARASAPQSGTLALVVVHRGALVHESYAEGCEADTPLLGWSMTKSVTATLVGRLVHEGRLDVDAPAPVAEWARDGRAAITLDDLLRMRSGLAWTQSYTTPWCDSLNMLFVASEAAAAPRAARLERPPGTRWSYSDGTSNVVATIVLDALSPELGERLRAPRALLFEPLGMRSASIAVDGSGAFVGSSLMLASARDWARFGLLYARDGVWRGRRLLPEGWVDYVGRPTPGSDRARYGAHFWRIARGPFAGVLSANGHQGQYLFVDPVRDVVIVRLGHRAFEDQGQAFAVDVLAAFP